MNDSTRYDLYAPIHKALRLFMTDTLQRLGRLDLGDARDMQDSLEQLQALLEAAGLHVQHENTFVHPVIERHHPGASASIAGDHQEHLEAITGLRTELALLRAQPTPAQAHRLYRHLARFVADNLEHMDIEETRHNQLLWSSCDDAELTHIEAAIHATIDAQEMALWMRWLLPALSPAERANLIRGMPHDARTPTLHAARPLLGDAAWRKLCAALDQECAPETAEAMPGTPR